MKSIIKYFVLLAFLSSIAVISISASPKRVYPRMTKSTGRQPALVILLSFSDKDFTTCNDANEYYSDMLNKVDFTNGYGANGSARDWFVKNSMGAYQPDFTIVGPIKLSQTSAYYGSDDPSRDAKLPELFKEACEKADELVDYSIFDTDNDGIVDNIYFFYAGYGSSDHPNGGQFIYPHAGYFDDSWNLNLQFDGKKLHHYAMSNEIRYSTAGLVEPAGIGVFVHEFCHVLGLVDHYDVSYGSSFGLSSWDTMATGEYNNGMDSPPLLSAFERASLGWLEYEDLTLEADSINVLPPLADSNKAYRIKVPDNDNEYFILENRQQNGFDSFIPGHGMLLWHIDYDESLWASNAVNYKADHQHIDIVEADGKPTEATRESDCFPGKAGTTQYDISAWDGSHICSIDDVVERGDTIYLLLADTEYQLPSPVITLNSVNANSFEATFSAVSFAQKYLVDVKDAEGNTVSGFDEKEYASASSIVVEGLNSNSSYTIEVTAMEGSYQSKTATLSLKTKDISFEDAKTTVYADEISSSGFTAHWDAIEGATDYQVSLFTIGQDGNTRTQGYDFTDKGDGMPASWETSSTSYYSISGYYGSASPSLRLSKDGDYLTIAYPGTVIDNIRFWAKGKSANGNLIVETQKDGTWSTIATLSISTDAATYSYDTDGAESVRLRLEYSGAYVCIDDVEVVCRGTQHSLVSENRVGNVLQHTFTGLSSEKKYAFNVKGVKDDVFSQPSDDCEVTLTESSNKTINLGYCNGEMASENNYSMVGKGNVEAAVSLPTTALSSYAGNEITKIRVALVARTNIDTLTVWVRSSLNGENLVQGTITKSTTPAINKGWNEVELDSPLDISSLLANLPSSTSNLYIGFSYHQKAQVGALSFVGNTDDGVSFVKFGDAGWKDVSPKGALGVEAIVEGENIHSYDVGLQQLSVVPAPTAGAFASKFTVTVHNYGAEDVTGFTLLCKGETTDEYTKDFSVTIPSASTTTLTWILPDAVGSTDDMVWTAQLKSLANGEDECEDNNQVEASTTYLRNVVVEEFTTERCSNCPRVAGYLSTALESDDIYAERVSAVCHHSGYFTDEFTQPCDEPLIWLFAPDGASYAPAVMVDRFAEHGESNSTAWVPADASDITTYFDQHMALPADVVVDVTAEYDEGGHLVINGAAKRKATYTDKSPRLCIYLTENMVESTYQSGSTGTYYQQHLTRAFNSTWGDAVVWTDDHFATTMTVDLDPLWNLDNMQVVAFVYNYDDANNLNCAIANSAHASLTPHSTDGIENVYVEDNSRISSNVFDSREYNILGQSVSGKYHGIVIKKGKKMMK